MNECWSEGELRAYLDRELPAEDMQRVAAHLEVCSDCGDLWTELAGRASRVSALMDTLAEPARTASKARPARRAGKRWIWAGAAAALAAGLLLGFLAIPKRQPQVAVLPPVLPPSIPVVRRTPDPIALPAAHEASTITPAARPGRVRSAQAKRVSPQASPLDNDFVALDDEPISTGVVLRVELGPRGIPADVIFGPDGRPHAIRLASNQAK